MHFDYCELLGSGADSVIVLSKLHFNYPIDSPECSVGVSEYSWGAIKSFYKGLD